MSIFIVGLLLSLGGGTWVYTKIQRITGGNSQTSALFGAIAGALLFVLTLIIGHYLPK
jgi:divalent metal cation (Fe/Co/Zn/Cd) transporter